MVNEQDLKEQEERMEELKYKVKDKGIMDDQKLKDLKNKIQRYKHMNSERMPEGIKENLYEALKEFNERVEEVYG